MELHCLDLGIARFAEFSLLLVLPGQADLNHLKASAKNLLHAWPILNMRVSLLRGKLSNTHARDSERFWQFVSLDHYTLNDIVPDSDNQQCVLTRSKQLDSLLETRSSWTRPFHPPVVSVKAAVLKDACILKFIVQHAFCDATGLYNIIRAYSSLLEGGTVNLLTPRPKIQLNQSCDVQGTSAAQYPPDLGKLQMKSLEVGWQGPLKIIAKQWLSPANSVTRRVLVSGSKIEELQDKASELGVRVTSHDLVLGCIYKASMASHCADLNNNTNGFPPFMFALNISRQLKDNAELHNPFILVTTPTPKVTASSEAEFVVRLAAHIRATIVGARSVSFLQQIVGMHRDAKRHPVTLKSLSTKATGIMVSSWTHIPLSDIELQVCTQNRAKPTIIEPDIAAADVFKNIGLKVENMLFTGRHDHGGFWVQGSLEMKVWTALSKVVSDDS